MPRGVGVTRVSIVEDHELFAEALDVALTLEGHDVRRVGVQDHPPTRDGLLTAILRQRPQIVLLDLDLGSGMDGTRLVEPLSREGVAVIVITATTDAARLGECLRYGARAVAPKSNPLNAILAMIRSIRQGRPAVDREERDRLLVSFHRQQVFDVEARQRLASLTRREQEVLGELMEGRTVAQIARSSYVSEATVRTQVKSIRAKLGVTSQLGAVGVAVRTQWRPPALRRPASA